MNHNSHIFAICAYGESPYLEECVYSVTHQTQPAGVLIATSTPNEHIERIAQKYNIPVYVNTGESGITQDWNFAYAQADADYVTITHQDDRYGPDYSRIMLWYMQSAKRPLIFFTDYAEIRDREIVGSNRLLRVKRMMLIPMLPRFAWSSIWIRRRVLSMGSPICCPSVTFAKRNLPDTIFLNHFRADEDWEAWERLSKLPGEFMFCRKILTYHRIHKDSETSHILKDNKRTQEDLYMFRKFWPEKIARALAKLYQSSEKSNHLS